MKSDMKTPEIVEIFPIYSCNFICKNCIFSRYKEDRGFVSDKVSLDFEIYQKFIRDCTGFKDKINIFIINGVGEPLIHPHIVEMVALAKISKIAERVEITTNATLLNRKMSDELIKAGLDRLVVSIKGLTSEQYYETSGVEINIKNIIEYLTYYYKNKRDNQEVYIKISDEVIEYKEDEEKFNKLFGDICDGIVIENNVPYFTLQLTPDGDIVGGIDYPLGVVGNIYKENVVDIWNNKSGGMYE